MELIVVHYAENLEFKLSKIEIENCPIFPRIKPKGGVWTSPIRSKYGWDKWCKSNNYGSIDKLTKVEMVIEYVNNKNLIVIDDEKDLDKLIWESDPMIKHFFEETGFKAPFGEFIDFEKMRKKGVDAIWLTEKGERRTRFIYPRNLYGWDCETILILNERCVKSWRYMK